MTRTKDDGLTGFYKYTLIVFAATFQTKQGYCTYHPKVDDKIYLSQYIKSQVYSIYIYTIYNK